MQLNVVKNEVCIEVLFANLKVLLLCHKGKSTAHLQQILGDVGYQLSFNILLFHSLRLPHKVEDVGVFHQVICQVALRLRQTNREIVHFPCFYLPCKQIALYLSLESVTTPPISNCLCDIPIAFTQR